MDNSVRNRQKIVSHRDLEVYQIAFKAAMTIFEMSKKFPPEEKFALTDQIRRSSRSVCSNIAEAWRRRRYEGSFLLRLNDSEAEAAETQSWLEFAVACKYLTAEETREIYATYNEIIAKIVTLINNPEPWLLKGKPKID